MSAPAVGSMWRHRKRRTAYQVTSLGKLQLAVLDDAPVVVYQEVRPASDRSCPETWVRPVSEFLDGRFEQVEVCPSCHGTGFQMLAGSLALMPLCPACHGQKFTAPEEG